MRIKRQKTKPLDSGSAQEFMPLPDEPIPDDGFLILKDGLKNPSWIFFERHHARHVTAHGYHIKHEPVRYPVWFTVRDAGSVHDKSSFPKSNDVPAGAEIRLFIRYNLADI